MTNEPVQVTMLVIHALEKHHIPHVTGYVVLQNRLYQHTLMYVGIAAHKTSVESLWASLIRGKSGVLDAGHIGAGSEASGDTEQGHWLLP